MTTPDIPDSLVCPTCNGEGVEFLGDDDDTGDACPDCDGAGHLLGPGMTAAEIRARYRPTPENTASLADEASL